MIGHGAHGGSGRGLAVSAALTGIYFFIELAVGLYTGSVAVLSDAFHTFSAVGGVLVAMAAARVARRPADATMTFGSYRAEIVGALANGVFLLGMALVVLVMGAMRLNDPQPLETGPMLWVALGGLVTEVISLWLLYGQQKTDLNVRGAFWHVLQTFVGSLIIIVAVVVIRFTGFLAIDPLLGMAFGLVLLWAGWGIVREAVLVLMEATPEDIDLPGLVETLERLPDVEDVHHVHAWQLTSGKAVFSAHVRIGDGRSAEDVLRAAHDRARDAGFVMATVQVEHGACLDEAAAGDLEFRSQTPPAGHDAAQHGEQG